MILSGGKKGRAWEKFRSLLKAVKGLLQSEFFLWWNHHLSLQINPFICTWLEAFGQSRMTPSLFSTAVMQSAKEKCHLLYLFVLRHPPNVRALKLLNMTAFLVFSSLGEGKHFKGSVFLPLLQWHTEEKIGGQKNHCRRDGLDRDFILISIATAYLWHFYSYSPWALATGFMYPLHQLPTAIYINKCIFASAKPLLASLILFSCWFFEVEHISEVPDGQVLNA